LYFILSITVSLQEFVFHVIYFCEFTGICISSYLFLWVYRNLYFILSITVSLQHNCKTVLCSCINSESKHKQI